MTIQQIEAKMIELKHREPFMPFAVEMADGQLIEIPDGHLVINETGAGYIADDGGIIDMDFKHVRAIHLLNSETAV